MPMINTSTVPSATTSAPDTSAQAGEGATTQAGTSTQGGFVLKLLADPPVPGAPVGGTQYTEPSTAERASLRKPTKSQMAHAAAVPLELAWLATQIDWTATFSNLVPTQDQSARAVTLAAEWTGERTAAANWLKQASGNTAVSWDTALHVLTLLTPGLTALLAAHPEYAPRLTATQAMISARSESSKKAATTRKTSTTARKRATKQSASASHNTAVANATEAAHAILHPATVTAPTTPPAGGTPSSGSGGHNP